MKDALKGIYRPQSRRKQSETHLVVFTGKETLCYQLDEDKWYHLADAPAKYADKLQSYQMSSFHGKLYVFPSSPDSCSVSGEIYDPSYNCWTELDRGLCPPDPKVELGFEETADLHITRILAVTVVQGDMYCYVAVHADEDWGLVCAILYKYNLESNTWKAVSTDLISQGKCILGLAGTIISMFLVGFVKPVMLSE